MKIVIDNIACDCEKGEYLLDVAARYGIDIPVLCHHAGLPEQGCCRVCIAEVEINNWRTVVTACVYPVERECAVFTNSENVVRQRKMVLALLRALAPESSKVADLCEKYDAPSYSRFTKQAGQKCVLCGLCVRACDELGTGAIATINRGTIKAVATPYDEPSLDCVGCASCAMVCPTAAIDVKEVENRRTIWQKEFPLKECENCGIIVGTFMELDRTAAKANNEAAKLCDNCKKKAITDVMAETYGTVKF